MTGPHIADTPSAAAAAASIVSALGLSVDEAVVVHVSNRLAVRLLPCDLLARVAPGGDDAARLEVELAQRLARAGSPVGTLDPRVPAEVYERDGFQITLWTHYNARPINDLAPHAYAHALSRLHAGLQSVDLRTPHFMDRVGEAERLIESVEPTPEFGEADRGLLARTLAAATRSILERGAAEQLLHGEPHPGNLLNTADGPLFIDLETCCRGPVEFDLAHVPDAVSAQYPGVDGDLLSHCRVLVLAMVAAWRLDPQDRFPRGRDALRELVITLRAGPPYPSLGTITGLN